MTINRVIHDNNLEYVINGRAKYEDMNRSEIREAVRLSFGDGTHPIAQFLTCFTELVRDAQGDTDIILRKNGNYDYVLLVDALDQFGDEVFVKSSAGRESPIIERYPNGIYECGIRRMTTTTRRSRDRELYFNALSAYAALASEETYSASPESYVYEMLYDTSMNFGDLYE